ncbi:MAG: hypothetical protein D6723_14385 [Acidobacteria bacterium]|nr:MAG: hypothetical protein D6723_14385 [Acidobacteriota bacterium]
MTDEGVLERSPEEHLEHPMTTRTPCDRFVLAGRHRWLPLMLVTSLAMGWTAMSGTAHHDGVTYYVDARRGDDERDGRTPATRWRTLGRANAAVHPGDTVLIFGGVYHQTLRPGQSGTAARRIIYRAVPGQPVIIERTEWLIDLNERSYITVEGIIFRHPLFGWGEIRNGHHNEIIGNRFIASGRQSRTAYAGLLVSDGASDNRIIGNVFRDWGDVRTEWGDALRVSRGAHHTLIEGNTFLNAGHALVDIDTSFTIVRRNYFQNAWQKDLDIVWQVHPRWAPGEQFIARRNIIEYNLIVGAHRSADGKKGGSGMQVAAAETIVRRNVFLVNEESGLIIDGWNEAPHVYGNRVYHNTFVGNGSTGIMITNWGIGRVDLDDNVIKNNVFYGNGWRDRERSIAYRVRLRRTKDVQCLPAALVIAGNCWDADPLADLEGMIEAFLGDPMRFWNVLETNRRVMPRLVDPAVGDVRLAEECGCIDIGVPLTRTRSAGSGNVVPVVDASYFTDGAGLIPGDRVKIGAQPAIAVLHIDWAEQTLTLARPIRWHAGDPVYLDDFRGRGPDAGVVEFGDALWPVPWPHDSGEHRPQRGMKSDSGGRAPDSR